MRVLKSLQLEALYDNLPDEVYNEVDLQADFIADDDMSAVKAFEFGIELATKHPNKLAVCFEAPEGEVYYIASSEEEALGRLQAAIGRVKA